ncbi:MAG: aminotransferase class I/II-fold pyridoxal phosphate-dependent enzyme [Candidatus Lokiarchaeota archaeon]|nr:aminotransferase class I/II-fold pyridoxal phosphate-dependent enzyme [Candidatus Lokiarchaeota archaeon]
MLKNIEKVDPEIAKLLRKELERQRNGLELIASENYASRAILEAQGCIMTNKYAEGYPGRRYYGGCEFYDVVENLARDRAEKLFKADHANVQPHSGTQANMAVYFSVIKPGDTIMSMKLQHGGHLSHGSPVNFTGKLYNIVGYGVDRETETLDYENLHEIALEHKPNIIIAGASAYPRKIDFKKFREIADEVGAYLLCDIAHIAGLIAAELHPTPVPHSQFVTFTTQKTLRGPRGGMIICEKEFSKQIDKSVFPGTQGGPLMHEIAAKAVCFKEAMSKEWKNYQKQIIKNSKAIATVLMENGFNLVSRGTDNHLMLVNLSDKDFTGKDAEEALEKANITLNKNTIPFDERSPFITSGIRIGTPCITSRGMKEQESETIANLISEVLNNINDKKIIKKVKKEVIKLCKDFPIYPDLY